MVVITKSDALNIYKFLYHYQDLMRENIHLDDGDELSQIHRRLHHLIMESYPDVADDDQISMIDPQCLLSLPQLALRTPSGDSSSLKFVTRSSSLIDDNDDLADQVVAVITFENGDEVLVADIKSLTLKRDALVLRDDVNDIHEFSLTRSNKQWISALGLDTERFIDEDAKK